MAVLEPGELKIGPVHCDPCSRSWSFHSDPLCAECKAELHEAVKSNPKLVISVEGTAGHKFVLREYSDAELTVGEATDKASKPGDKDPEGVEFRRMHRISADYPFPFTTQEMIALTLYRGHVKGSLLRLEDHR